MQKVPNKEELDMLKTIFYKIHLAERDAQTKEYLAAGGDPEKYVLLPDDTEEAFKAEMQIIKEKRSQDLPSAGRGKAGKPCEET